MKFSVQPEWLSASVHRSLLCFTLIGFISILGSILGMCGVVAASTPQYVVTNDDVASFPFSGVSFYTVGSDGSLTFQTQVSTEGNGIGGGYFTANRVAMLNSGSSQCVFASQAATGTIAGINVNTLQLAGTSSGSSQDTGTTNGIGLAVNSQYLYASFSDTSIIGTFQVLSGCELSFVSDVAVGGLQGGIIAGMAVHGNMLVATYADGSIESFDIASGPPVSNGDKQNSTAYIQSAGATYPNGIDITKDGHFALFGDTSTSTVVEVSDISSGKLKKPVSYTFAATINSSNLMLSPDETLIYIADTQGDRISAASFNATTGKVSAGCASGRLKGYVSGWTYLAAMALQSNTGTGGTVYVAEFGAPSTIGVVQVGSSGGKCTLTESSSSSVADANSSGLLSIGSFPPRTF